MRPLQANGILFILLIPKQKAGSWEPALNLASQSFAPFTESVQTSLTPATLSQRSLYVGYLRRLLAPRLGSNFFREIALFLLDALTQNKASKATNLNVFA